MARAQARQCSRTRSSLAPGRPISLPSFHIRSWASLWGTKAPPSTRWGGRRAFSGRRPAAPWDARYLSLLRLRDWLRLLGFELNGGVFGCYAPPCAQPKWLARFAFMEKAGARWWPIAGGVYVVRAIKRVQGMRLVTPAWRKERARRRRALAAPIAQRHQHDLRHHE